MTDKQCSRHNELNNNNFHKTPFHMACQRPRSLRIASWRGVKQRTFCKS